MACFDTSFLIDLYGRNGRDRMRRAEVKLKALEVAMEPATVTRFSLAELFVGLERVADRRRERKLIDDVLADYQILEFNASAAELFGRLKAHLLNIGRPAGDMDTLIASVALVSGEFLVTGNPRHFADMPGLVVEGY